MKLSTSSDAEQAPPVDHVPANPSIQSGVVDGGDAAGGVGSANEPLPPFKEWRKLPPDEAARVLAKHRNLDARQEGFIAAILEHFCEDKRD